MLPAYMHVIVFIGGFPLKKSVPVMILSALALCLALFPCAATAEDTQSAFVEPTRAPGASAWSSDNPDFLEPDMLICDSAIVIEASSGNVVFEKNADQIMYPASTTKILTALLGIQFCDLDENVTVSYEAIDDVSHEDDVTMLPLEEGEIINMRELLYGTMLKSANEGANVIAEAVAGSIDDFVVLMNDTAAMLGCSENTHFANPHGLHDDNHYTTARDMAIIAREAMKNETFRDIVSRSSYEMAATNRYPRRSVLNSNTLLNAKNNDKEQTDNRFYYPYAIGIKTGYTARAGYCFVGAAEKNGIEMISVVFYSSRYGRWTDTRALLEYAFTQYDITTPMELYAQDPREIEIMGFALDDTMNGSLALGRLELGIRLPTGENAPTEDIKIIGTVEEIQALRENISTVSHVNWTREFRAPVTVGETMGTLTFYPENGDPVEYELYATRSVAAREDAPPTLEEIEAYTLADPNPFPHFSEEYVVVPAILLILLWMLIRRLRGKRLTKRKQTEQKLPKPKARTFR